MATPTRKERLKQRKRKKGKSGVGIVKQDTAEAVSVLVQGQGAIGSGSKENASDRQHDSSNDKHKQDKDDVVGGSINGNHNTGGISVTEDGRNDEGGVGCRQGKTDDGSHAGATV
ncbi:MAG: hypothetical protein GY739_07710, partial [Mesoflavibacter sp.]|nr:hypothetical protein [Mesoflavibacter sp.]